MAAPGFGTSPFVLPNSFDTPGNALQQGLVLQERRAERQADIDFRNQRIKEQDDWKKLNLIQDLTNIDKYQTGESVADAIGHQKANELFTKYTAQAGSMSPAELQYNIAKEIGTTTNAMQSMKDELVQSDAKMKLLKSLYPSLDAATLMRDVRGDIVNRRMQGSEFTNPTTVNPSTLNLDDQDFLSDYIDVNKGLKEAVVNPKNMQKDVTALVGSPSSYTSFKGNLPYYMKENFDREKDFKSGFYTGKQEPSMSLKTSVVPKGAFSGANQAIDVLDKDAYEALRAEGSEVDIALRKLAKSKYRDYNSMTNEEKEIARRDVAKDFITPFSKNYQFRAETATKPPRISVNTGSASSVDTKINDVYEGIDEMLTEMEGKGSKWLNVSTLKPDAKEVVMKAAKTEDESLTPDKLQIIRGEDGTLRVFKIDGDFVNYVPRVATNINKQANVAGKKAVVGAGEPQNKSDKKRTYKGLDKDGNPIFE